MAQEFKLDIFKRDDISKSSLKQLRRDGNIPGIFYSYNSKESIPFYMESKTLAEAKKSGARIFNIAVGSSKQTVIFKAVQYHPVTDEILHVDLYGVNMEWRPLCSLNCKIWGNSTFLPVHSSIVALAFSSDPNSLHSEGFKICRAVS